MTTTYAWVRDGAILAEGDPPRVWRDGSDVLDWRDPTVRTPETFAPYGWLPTVETPRPADTPTTTCDAGLVLVDGVPTRTWTVREKTFDELALDAAAVEQTNAITLTDRARAAIETNQAFLALDPPTTAQVVAQVRALTRENTALIRLVTRALSETSGT